MTYEQARREVRKLLRSDKGEVKELPDDQQLDALTGFMPYRFLVGKGQGKSFVVLAAGMTWAEAIADLRKMLVQQKGEQQHGR